MISCCLLSSTMLFKRTITKAPLKCMLAMDRMRDMMLKSMCTIAVWEMRQVSQNCTWRTCAPTFHRLLHSTLPTIPPHPTPPKAATLALAVLLRCILRVRVLAWPSCTLTSSSFVPLIPCMLPTPHTPTGGSYGIGCAAAAHSLFKAWTWP
jgi:hypothetical protein